MDIAAYIFRPTADVASRVGQPPSAKGPRPAGAGILRGFACRFSIYEFARVLRAGIDAPGAISISRFRKSNLALRANPKRIALRPNRSAAHLRNAI